MATEILMPKLGLTMKTGTIVQWLKSEGEQVLEKEHLLEIETEKLSYSVESPANGSLLKIIAVTGEKYPVSTVLGYIGQPNETVPGTTDQSATSRPISLINRMQTSETNSEHMNLNNDSAFCILNSALPTGRIFITPVAKKMASSKGIDYRQIKGTGPNGRIVKADVLAFESSRITAAAPPQSVFYSETKAAPDTSTLHYAPGTVVPYVGIRRIIGETMTKAWTTIPMVTHHVSADAGSLLDYRTMLNTGVSDKNDLITIGELILKLTAFAITLTPIMNSSLTSEGIVIHRNVHLGMATALDEGLVVPVIRDADVKRLLALSHEAKSLASRARSGTISPDELQGATFTVSNLGGFGSVDHFTPIINPPEAAILGVGRIKDTVVAVDGEMAIRPMIGLSITYDHRIIDGATAATFMKNFIKLMENPARAVLSM